LQVAVIIPPDGDDGGPLRLIGFCPGYHQQHRPGIQADLN